MIFRMISVCKNKDNELKIGMFAKKMATILLFDILLYNRDFVNRIPYLYSIYTIGNC